MANTPTYIAYYVKDTNAGENGEKRGVWTKVGAAWPHADGKGLNLMLDGRVTMRVPSEREDAPTGQPLST